MTIVPLSERYEIVETKGLVGGDDAQDVEDAIAALRRWVHRNGRNGYVYSLLDREKAKIIHAITHATNPDERDPIDTRGRFISNRGDGTFQAFYDGWSTGPSHTSYEDAASELFRQWAYGGYNALYYFTDSDDGFILGPFCGSCAKDEWLADESVPIRVENDDDDVRYTETRTCDNCNEVISAHLCSECGDEVDNYSGILFVGEYGHTFHDTCMASLVVNGKATKKGLLTYEVEDGWYANYEPFVGSRRDNAQREATDRQPVYASGD